MKMTRLARIVAAWVLLDAGCGAGSTAPAVLDPGHENCGTCRMVISDASFASQIVTPNEEPRFFDDFGCLTRYLDLHGLPATGRVYVADHRTHAWIPAGRAVYTVARDATAPMGSHVIAHESTASRDLDTDARGGTPMDPREAPLLTSGGSR
jgi:copper chaperone NosL